MKNQSTKTIYIYKNPLVAIFLVIFLVVCWFYLNSTIFGLYSEEVNNFIYSLGKWSPLFMIGLIISEYVIAPLPGSWLPIASGFIFGPWLGFVYSYIATLLGSIIAFEISRLVFHPLIKNIIQPAWHEKFKTKLKSVSWVIILIFALPLFPVDIVVWILGLLNIERKNFLIMAAIGLVPNIALTSFLGTKIAFSQFQYFLVITTFIIIGFILVNQIRLRLQKKPS
ncbi:MAG: VTT domain-containing protein [bacterium]|nr:VTT domain-containing protein [bacterium]